MKKIILILPIFLFFISCNGQNPAYSTRSEYGLKGKVKQVISYICKVEDNEIPKDTADFFGRYTMTFDEAGNAIQLNKVYNIPGLVSREYKMTFKGTGKDITFKDNAILDDGKMVESNYKYVWLDDYNYTINSLESDTFSSSVSLDKNYRLIKNVYGGEKIDGRQTTEEFETIYQNDRIQKIINKITENMRNDVFESVQIQVMKEYDNQGNPTVIYVFNDKSEQKIEQVIYKEYQYH